MEDFSGTMLAEAEAERAKMPLFVPPYMFNSRGQAVPTFNGVRGPFRKYSCGMSIQSFVCSFFFWKNFERMYSTHISSIHAGSEKYVHYLEQVQVQKYKPHAYKTLKMVGVQI